MFDANFAARFTQLLRWRRDVGRFERRAVAEEDMRELLGCAALAPSVGNAQPWRFVRLRSPDIREALAAHVDDRITQAAERYAEHEQRNRYLSLKLHGLREAPELMTVFCDERPEAGHGLGIATMPEALRYSTVLAIHNLWLAARLRGIGVGWVSILDPRAVHAMLGVPAQWSLIALLCIGYPTEESDTPELERRGWQAREALRPISGTANGAPFQGYEMHMGKTTGQDTARPFAKLSDGSFDGAMNAAGTVFGSYVHGLLANAQQRRAFLSRIDVEAGGIDYRASVDMALDEIACILEANLDIEALVTLALSNQARPGSAGIGA